MFGLRPADVSLIILDFIGITVPGFIAVGFVVTGLISYVVLIISL